MWKWLFVVCVALPVMASEPLEVYDLEVRVNSFWNPNFFVCTQVRFNQPFVVRSDSGEAGNVFWGELHPPKEGKYQLDFAVYEWKSEKSQIGNTHTIPQELKLDQPIGIDRISGGVVHGCSVTLRRHAQE